MKEIKWNSLKFCTRTCLVGLWKFTKDVQGIWCLTYDKNCVSVEYISEVSLLVTTCLVPMDIMLDQLFP